MWKKYRHKICFGSTNLWLAWVLRTTFFLVFFTGSLYHRVMERKRAVVLLSGGVDSSTVLAVASREAYKIHALSFRYGQRHEREIEAAKRIVAFFDVQDHRIINFNLRAIGGSALTDQIDVPKGREPEEISRTIPVTYVPARNTIFLSFALSLAEKIEAEDIFFGANQLDYSGYPDCRGEYIRAFEEMANLATKAGVEGRLKVKIHTPLIQMTKAEIVRKGLELGLDFSLTWSCYDPTADGLACGLCDSCQLRLKGFREAGFDDPIAYAPKKS
ncbi:MAG: 7-cyano-7-deazaguanine synthase QueC [Candidatus Binatia bacterium]|nr:7-cyano-7-deazaguanine synthase QueC [Deltaproteobacteria bacterium]